MHVRLSFQGRITRIVRSNETSDKIHRTVYKKKSPDYISVIEAQLKGGGYLLSRIALQYHRRKRA